MTDLELVGRESELAALDQLWQRCAAGSHALQIEGAAGVGKTALWLDGLAGARRRSFEVLTSRPVEIETKLSFAGLTDLLEPVLDEVLPELPEPQRRAFEVALLIAPARMQPDRRSVAAAFLGALRAIARDRPVVVAIDDVQWLDSSSQQVVSFAARRLGSERVGFLVTRRTADDRPGATELEGTLPAERLERVTLGPLSITALSRLVEAELGHAPPHPLLRRIYGASGGNPFFALEQTRALKESGLNLGTGSELPIPQTLRALVQTRLARIGDAEREVLLAVAALAAPTRELLVSLVGAGENGWPPLIDAFEARIVEVVDGQIRFTHPLLGSVLYADTPLPVRQELHRRLAELVHDPEESARHLALSVDGSAEPVASRLEAAARFAAARGAPSSAGELLELAIGRTPRGDRSVLRRRYDDAARQWTAAGDAVRAIALAEKAVEVAPPGSERAESLVHLGRAVSHAGDCRAAAGLFAEALDEPCDAPRVLVSLQKELVWSNHMLGDVRSAERHAHEAVVLAEALGERAVLAETLADLALIQMLRRRDGFRATMDRALELELAEPQSQEAVDGGLLAYWWLTAWQNALLLAWAGELEAARETLERLHLQATERGDEHTIPFVLPWLSRIAFQHDDLSAAADYADRACEASVSAPGELVFALVSRVSVAARRGDVEDARKGTDEGLRLAEKTGMVSARFEHQVVRAGLELSLGESEVACRLLAPLPEELERHGFAEPIVFRFHPDLIEALVARGDTAAAGEQLAELQKCAERFPRSWAVGATARCRGLLAAETGEQADAFAHFESALVHHDRTGERFERGRTLLLYGIALRRARRKRDAREALAGSEAIFAELGAAAWAARARGERHRISGAAPSSGGLTETERRIADLATAGRSNKQIAAELHITVRTVESNLTRVYRKLGVSSRGQLAQLAREQVAT
jgi:DNA-binding CsgD family transcriptional regulator